MHYTVPENIQHYVEWKFVLNFCEVISYLLHFTCAEDGNMYVRCTESVQSNMVPNQWWRGNPPEWNLDTARREYIVMM